AFALRSHERALAAIDSGKFAEEIVPVTATLIEEVRLKPDTPYGGVSYGGGTYGNLALAVAPKARQITFAVDEGPRRDTSAKALAKLRPAFHAKGSVTAGNSSQTSDGAAAVIVTSAARAKAAGLTPMARFVTFATAGVE